MRRQSPWPVGRMNEQWLQRRCDRGAASSARHGLQPAQPPWKSIDQVATVKVGVMHGEPWRQRVAIGSGTPSWVPPAPSIGDRPVTNSSHDHALMFGRAFERVKDPVVAY